MTGGIAGPGTGAVRAAALLAWGCGSLFFFYAFALRVSPSVMVDELMRDFRVSALVLGNLSAFYFYIYAAVQIPVGVLMDRLGPRRLMTAAALVCALGCYLFAASEQLAGAYLGRLLIGLGCAFAWVGVLTVIAESLPARRFAVFVGGGQFAGTLGAIAGQAPLGLAVETVGWRLSMSWLALAGVALAAGLWLAVRDRPRPFAPAKLAVGLRSAAGNPQTWLLAGIGLSLTGSALAFAGLWGVPWFAAVYQLPKPAAAQLLSLVFIGWLLGAPVIGWLSDRRGRRRPLLIAGTLLSTLTIATVLYLKPPPALVGVLLFLNGVGGSSMILVFAAGREHNTEQARGAALGLINTCVVASGALFQPLIGALLDWRWQGAVSDGVRLYGVAAYDIALLALPLGAVLGFVLALLLREVPPRR